MTPHNKAYQNTWAQNTNFMLQANWLKPTLEKITYTLRKQNPSIFLYHRLNKLDFVRNKMQSLDEKKITFCFARSQVLFRCHVTQGKLMGTLHTQHPDTHTERETHMCVYAQVCMYMCIYTPTGLYTNIWNADRHTQAYDPSGTEGEAADNEAIKPNKRGAGENGKCKVPVRRKKEKNSPQHSLTHSF